MITVHHLEKSRSQRVLWLLEELGVEYEIRLYKRNPKTNLAPPELKSVHPLGKSPVITDGDLTIAESGAITEYLIDKYSNGRFRPAAGTPEALRNSYWMHYAEGSMMPYMVMTIVFDRIRQAPLLVRPIAKAIANQVEKGYLGPNIKTNLEYINRELGDGPYFCGSELTGADFQMIIPLIGFADRIKNSGAYPNISAYIERVTALPTFKRAQEKA